jgi:hypothetical protein
VKGRTIFIARKLHSDTSLHSTYHEERKEKKERDRKYFQERITCPLYVYIIDTGNIVVYCKKYYQVKLSAVMHRWAMFLVYLCVYFLLTLSVGQK